MPALTGRERAALIFLRDYIAQRQYPPTIAELAAGIGLRSKSGAWYLLTSLVEKGYIVREGGPRALRIVTLAD